MVNPHTGRVHTTFSQATAVTGRLASTDPNLQNIPVRTAEGRRIREAFIAPPGSVIVSADYSQIELRIMAHLSSDPALLRAFHEGADIHRATAADIFGVPLAEVTTDQRRYIKAVNFGLIYGMSAFGLAQQLGIERGAAQQFIDKYFQQYPGVADVHAADARFRPRARLRRNGVRTAPVAARHQGGGRAASRRRRARGDQRADAGHGRGSGQARDDRGARLDSSAKGSRRSSCCRSTTSWCSKCRRPSSRACGSELAAADDGRRRAFRAAGRRCRRRPELGAGALADRLRGPILPLRGRAEDVLVARVDAGREHRAEHEPAEAEAESSRRSLSTMPIRP